MAFHFSLEVLLRLRRSVEHQQELLLTKANHEVNLVRTQIANIDECLTSLAGHVERNLNEGLSASELHFDNERGLVLRARRKNLEQELHQKEAQWTARSKGFQDARRDREVVETLYRRQFQLFRQADLRKEQRRMDEEFLLRNRFRS
ncbi:MAG TPA: flagellar export protein FliJ [Terriglobales bacterium]|jgi:flagellar export protein FliJ